MSLTASISCAGAGANEIVAAVTGRRIRVIGYKLVPAAAVDVKWQSAATDLTGLMSLAAKVDYTAPHTPDGPFGGRDAWFETAAGEALNLNLGGAVQVSGHINYELR